MGRILKGSPAGAAPREPAGPEGGQRPGAEAEALRAAAREEAARLREEALEEGRRRADALLATAREAVAAERARLQAEADGEIVELALAVAAKVLECAVEDGRAARESARKALARARRVRAAVLRVHPADAEPVRASADGWAPAGTALEVRADPGVGRGGVLLEWEAGTVDARLESQVGALARRLGEAA